eukprot:6209265-Pleurochrysis_carterae.AAC.3
MMLEGKKRQGRLRPMTPHSEADSSREIALKPFGEARGGVRRERRAHTRRRRRVASPALNVDSTQFELTAFGAAQPVNFERQRHAFRGQVDEGAPLSGWVRRFTAAGSRCREQSAAVEGDAVPSNKDLRAVENMQGTSMSVGRGAQCLSDVS